MELPILPYDFDHAYIHDVIIGPRREVSLIISPLVWENQQGYFISGIALRFGGIFNFDKIGSFFAMPCHNHTDIAWLRYDKSQSSKLNSLFFEIMYERIDAQIVIHCRNISVTAPELPTAQVRLFEAKW